MSNVRFYFQSILKRLCGLLEACIEELPDVPFYYHVMKDFGIVLKSSLMKGVVLRSALINAGFRYVELLLKRITVNTESKLSD